MIAPFPSTIKRGGDNGTTIMLSREQEAWLRKYYPTELTQQLAFIMGIHRTTLARFANKLRLTKAPAYFQQKKAKLGEMAKKLIHSERLRQKWCLPRQTKYNLPQKPFTRQEIMRRRRATERGYIVGDVASADRFAIFFDEHTRRMATFERNCIKAGFKIEQY